MTGLRSTLLAASLTVLATLSARAQQALHNEFPFLPPAPESQFLPVSDNAPDHGFCSRWDPEYGHLGKTCCSGVSKAAFRKPPKCAPNRIKWTFCDEMTDEQRQYLDLAKTGELGNWWENRGAASSQAFCSVNSGFLVNGRPIVPSAQNRLLVRNPMRCTQFGTDGLVAALEWVGREIGKEYSTPDKAVVRLNIGDLSAPRGGCISGRRGRRGHASHTTGQDADLGFLNTRVGSTEFNGFTTHFDAEANWWLVKKIFSNPYVCVKAVFVDKRMIRKLAKAALGDEMWGRVAHRIQHVRGHRSHFHVRVGHQPGEPGCPRELGWVNDGQAAPEDEEDMNVEEEAGQMVRGGTGGWEIQDTQAPRTSSTSGSDTSKDILSISSSSASRR